MVSDYEFPSQCGIYCGVSAKKVPIQFGRVCGFGDFNGDRNTDVIVQRGTNLTILLQDDEILNVVGCFGGKKCELEEGVFTNSTSFRVGDDTVECSLGDFNGDTKLDVLVSTKKKSNYYHSVWISSALGDEFVEHKLTALSSQALAIDVDGNGWQDVLGFFENGSMYCMMFNRDGSPGPGCSYLFKNFVKLDPYPKVPHLFVDLTGDHLAEIVFMDTTVSNGYRLLTPRMWGRFKEGWRETPTVINHIPGDHPFVGAPMAADFDADGLIELLVPICRKEDCKQVVSCEAFKNKERCTLVTEFANWQYNRGWSTNAFDLQSFNILSDEDSLMLFRVGDFSLDGFPDLVATLVEKQSLGQIKVIDNNPCTNCDRNGTRRFEISKSVFIQPKEVALGEIKMASFFDLKVLHFESTSLLLCLILCVSFIPCDEKGDVTFLKVTVFTSICGKRCKPSSKELGRWLGGLGCVGSGVSWGGACASFSMSDGWGGSLKSSACQIPAGTHRALAAPYILFGLGRSPNFVDEVCSPLVVVPFKFGSDSVFIKLTVGVPLYSESLNARQHSMKQIVPNSRIIVIPPEDGSHWLTRLYVTPSQLILQSLAVIATVCTMLLLVVAFLHYRERKEDRVERQQQSHRFHFDAM
ncbi:unnamed protein product [Heligmosomoides polygyrus]|uniref:T-cell immunomodulatory protein TIP C2 domain-containing protein n=1 Tax=Heligmosomoides polygyrus TaxID=6339 RepID=A0A3P7U7Y3_HELPZ|nr:unnamed protein product [Heligmosomoides polygyrus]